MTDVRDIKVIRDGDFYKLQLGGEVIRYCGCCGKKLDGGAVAALLAKLHADELEWKVIYSLGMAAEFIKERH